MSKTEELLEILTTEKYDSDEEAQELLRHFYKAMNQLIEKEKINRDVMFEEWALTQD